jgi:hypothetical protein
VLLNPSGNNDKGGIVGACNEGDRLELSVSSILSIGASWGILVTRKMERT